MSPTKKMEIKHTLAKILWPAVAVGTLAYGTLVLPNMNQEITTTQKQPTANSTVYSVEQKAKFETQYTDNKMTRLKRIACASPAYEGKTTSDNKGVNDWFAYEHLTQGNRNPNSKSLMVGQDPVSQREISDLFNDLNGTFIPGKDKNRVVLNLDGRFTEDGKPTLGYLLIPESIKSVPNPLIDSKTGQCKYESKGEQYVR